MKLEAALAEKRLQANTDHRHFNANRGLNLFKEVPGEDVVGRSMPEVPELEAQAEALHYADKDVIRIEREHNWLERGYGTREIPMADQVDEDGNVIHVMAEIRCETHRDHNVRALMQFYADDEVRQTVARGRVFDRGSSNVFDIRYFGLGNTGLPMHAFRTWKDAERDVADLMLRTGIVVRGPDAIRRLYPGRICSGGTGNNEAAVAWAWAIRCTTEMPPAGFEAIENDYLRECRFVAGIIKLRGGKGAGNRPIEALVDISRFLNPQQELSARFEQAVEWLPDVLYAPDEAAQPAEGCEQASEEASVGPEADGQSPSQDGQRTNWPGERGASSRPTKDIYVDSEEPPPEPEAICPPSSHSPRRGRKPSSNAKPESVERQQRRERQRERASLAALKTQVDARKAAAAAANDHPAPANDNVASTTPRAATCQSNPDPRKRG
jgi:hypothetical protein